MKAIIYSKFFVVLLICTIVTISCQKKESSNIQEAPESKGDKTSDDLMQLFDNFTVIEIDTSEIVGVNGLTIAEYNEYLKEKYENSLLKKSLFNSTSLSPNEQLVELTTNIAKNQVSFTLRANYANSYKKSA